MILADLLILACALTPLGYAVYRAWRLCQLEACAIALAERSAEWRLQQEKNEDRAGKMLFVENLEAYS